ncbi:MAG: ABC transporter permease [Rhizobiales bacterium]|nr:ABC transporter permease [Hyphomicrobiales bacterium]NRB13228.1 ABC transporter permease [Hyphomicrobiales bacterium]
MSYYEFMGTLELAFIFAILALGAFITFKILDFPDLTVEGSFPFGASVAAVLITSGLPVLSNPWVATFCAGIAGFGAGYLTATLNVKFKILHILSGILVATALYSINIRVMDGPNEPLLNVDTVYTWFDTVEVMASFEAKTLFLGALIIVIKLLLDAFLSTGIGLSMRAAGANPEMARANGINVDKMKLYGLGIANALAGVSGALFAQTIGASDAQSGIGMIIIGLASVIIGMSLMPSRLMWQATFAVILGTVAYRSAIAVALNADGTGLNASDLQMVTAGLVILVLVAQYYSRNYFAAKKGRKS